MPKTLTAKAIAANRANAKKSTGPRPQTNARRGEGSCGPRTPEGKARSSRNAVTPGVLADAVTAPSLEPYEDPAAFQALLAGLRVAPDPRRLSAQARQTGAAAEIDAFLERAGHKGDDS